jgi:hypothetical protein
MIAPEWVCRELERVCPRVRLGWAGRERTSPEQSLNQGSFMLLELVRVRVADRTFRTPWGDRGPVYGSDYDRLTQVPLMIYDVSPEDVFSGRVVVLLRRWLLPINQRIAEQQLERERALRSRIKDIAGDMGSHLYRQAQKSWEGGDIRQARKFETPEDRARLNGDWEASVPAPQTTPVAPVAVL